MSVAPTVGSLFSGIGGLDHGLDRAGFQHVFFCESDGYRREVLAARWPGVPVYDDVRAVGVSDGWERFQRRTVEDASAESQDLGSATGADLLCGGFPCQDLSVAGQRRGLDGDRSGLFFEFARIAESLRPRWLLVENVPGLLSSNGGRDFGTVVGTLADVGYGVAWRVLDSRFFGVPQRRRRVFIVGTLFDGDPRAAAERAGQVLAVGSRCPGHPATRGEAREDLAVASLSGLGTGGPDDNDGQANRVIAVPLSHGSNPNSNAAGRRREDDENLVAFHPTGGGDKGLTALSDGTTPGTGSGNAGTVAIADSASVRRLMPVECERLQALPDGWTDLGGTADSKRYAALGDAVTSSVAEWIGRNIIASQESSL